MHYINVLFYEKNLADTSYNTYSVIYNTLANSTITTIAFGFIHKPSWWFLDDILVVDLDVGFQVNLDGDFESGDLLRYYSICNLPESDTRVGGQVQQGCGTGGAYCYLDGTMNEPSYLFQSLYTEGGHSYLIRFGLKNYGGTPNMVMLLVGH